MLVFSSLNFKIYYPEYFQFNNRKKYDISDITNKLNTMKNTSTFISFTIILLRIQFFININEVLILKQFYLFGKIYYHSKILINLCMLNL